jgi:hypothetical protein
MMEGFKASTSGIQILQDAAANGVLVMAHVYGGTCTGPTFTTSLATFLIGAGHLSYFGCSSHWSVQSDPVDTAWHSEFTLPLGAPLGLGTQGSNGVWTRTFTGGPAGRTIATFDPGFNVGTIRWNGASGPPTPPPPRPAPPAPPTQPVPTQCGRVMSNVGQANAEISVKATTSAADCCAACVATATCEIWAWHTEGGGTPTCHLHTSAAQANHRTGCFSGHMNKTQPV